MKSILIFALLLTLGTVFLTGCTTVPRDTTVRHDETSSSTHTYSK
jgi:starvation-inducible outer membrane lipoprotein